MNPYCSLASESKFHNVRSHGLAPLRPLATPDLYMITAVERASLSEAALADISARFKMMSRTRNHLFVYILQQGGLLYVFVILIIRLILDLRDTLSNIIVY